MVMRLVHGPRSLSSAAANGFVEREHIYVVTYVSVSDN